MKQKSQINPAADLACKNLWCNLIVVYHRKCYAIGAIHKSTALAWSWRLIFIVKKFTVHETYPFCIFFHTIVNLAVRTRQCGETNNFIPLIYP